MDNINGRYIIDIFISVFQHYIINGVTSHDDYKEAKGSFISFLLNVIKKLIYVFKETNILFGFRYGDFDFRNCLILEDSTPVILDFGSSTIDNRSQSLCKDLRTFLSSFFNLLYYNKRVDNNQTHLKNCKMILDDILKDDNIHFLYDTLDKRCIPYLDIDVSLDELLAGITR